MTIVTHYSILDADDEDLIPDFGDDDELLPTLGVFFTNPIVELVYVGAQHAWVVTPRFALFPTRVPLDANRLRDSLRPGGTLLRLVEAVVQSASQDSGGLLAACAAVHAHLASLTASAA